MAIRANVESSMVTVFVDPETNAMPQGLLGHSNGVGTATLEWIEHTVQYRLPFVFAVGCLFLLLCMLGIELRYAMERRSRHHCERKSANPLTDMAWWLTVGAGILVFSAIATSLYFLDDPYTPGKACLGCLAFFIPVTPGWFLTMPIGAWSLSVLLRKEI